MKHVQYIRIAFCSVCLVSLLFLSGCSIFGPVGHAISQGYENSVSYFNGYYNAKWLFSEAEDEIRSDAFLKRGQESSSATVNQIPVSAKDKLTKVIDKCSNILAFHSTSTLVDDALILIGKSFYYQAEYLKAERKFVELLAQFPNSPLVLETQIWYARTEEKLGKVDDGIRICESTISVAKKSGDDEIEVQAHLLLGRFYLMSKQTEKTIVEYEIAVKLTTDEEIKTDAQIRLGDIYFSAAHYEEAARTYLQVGEYTSDVYSNYYSKLQAAVAFRKLKEYSKGLIILDAMIEDFKNKIYLPELLYERACNYVENGKRNDAIDEFTYVDTTYTPKEYSIRSAYQLGKIYENEIGDYQLALKYYAKVNPYISMKSLDDGRLKHGALTRYFEARKKLGIADSLLFVLREAKSKTMPDTLIEMVSDTAKQNDTLLHSQSRDLLADSILSKTGNLISYSPKSCVDSLKIIQFISDSIQHEISLMITQYSQSRADSLIKLKSLRDSLQNRIVQLSLQRAPQRIDSLKSRTDLTRQFNAQIHPQPYRSSLDSLQALKSMSDSIKRKNVETPSRRSQSKRDSIRVIELKADSMHNKMIQIDSPSLLSNIDSLKLKTDSLQNKTRFIASQDTLAVLDSLSFRPDSTKKKKTKVKLQPAGISLDSINVLKSIAAQELGDIFYSEVIAPDSAFYWYDHALTWNYRSTQSPRILYILAELSRENPRKEYPTAEEYYTRLDRDFPESIYTDESRRFLGKTSYSKKIDTAAVYYEQAERQVDTKQYKKAIMTYRALTQAYPQSPLAAKSDYAIGWILENHLALPESAFAQYKYVVKNYEGTHSALVAANQIIGALQVEKEKIDSLKRIAEKLDSVKAYAAKLDSVKMIVARKDSLKPKSAGMDTSKIKTSIKDTSKIMHGKIDSSNRKQTKIDSSKIRNVPMDTMKLDTLKADSASGNRNSRTPGVARKDSAEIRKRLRE